MPDPPTPWEDVAETWAHYLHIVDTLETAAAFGLSVHFTAGRRERDVDALLQAWLPLTYAVNSLNHRMGQPDLDPFVLAPAVMGKLRFVHGLMGRWWARLKSRLVLRGGGE